ncbi:MAG: DUF6326 family protein [Cytophagales bacterium]|nr:DUF6326 family protein [Cytophagales bacterium]
MNNKSLLSTLWIVLVVNFMFCDIFTLMHSEDLENLWKGSIDGVPISQGFLLTFAIVMEIPIAMILISRLLKPKPNRIINIISGMLLAIVQLWSLTVGNVTLHYWFFSIIEITLCISIVVIVWRWKTGAFESEMSD